MLATGANERVIEEFAPSADLLICRIVVPGWMPGPATVSPTYNPSVLTMSATVGDPLVNVPVKAVGT